MEKQTAGSANQNQSSSPPVPKWLPALVALIPCVASIVLAVSSDTLPRLAITKPRPSLLFATYLYHHGDQAVALTPTLESEFRFRNLGHSPVKITKIERSCGCLNPTILRPAGFDSDRESGTIEAGGYGAIYAPIATLNQKAGPQEYTLSVYYNDPVARRTTLTIKAIFPKKLVTVNPPAVFLSQKTERGFPLPELTVSDVRDAPLQVTDIYSSAPFITAEVAANTALGIQQVSMEEEYETSTKIQGKVDGGIPPGRHHALVAATTDDKEFPVITVPMIINGPAYPAGESAIMNPEQFQLVASDHPDAARKARLELVMPAAWQIDYAQSWPEQLLVEYSEGRKLGEHEKIVIIEVTLPELPPTNVKSGIIQVIANGGENLVTAKANFVWP